MNSRAWLLFSFAAGCSQGGISPGPDSPVDLAMTQSTQDDGGQGSPDLRAAADLALPFAEGKPLWSRSYAAAQTEDVAAGPDGSVYVTGSFARADFGDGMVSASGSSDVFLLKFDKNGQRLWAKTFGRTNSDVPHRVAVDKSGNAAVVGYSLRTSATGTHDAFVASYSTDGAQRYFRTYGGALDTAVDTSHAVAFAADGSVYVTGGFEDRIDFGGGSLVSAGSRDIFLLQLSAAGSHVLSKRWGFTGYDQTSSVSILPDGDLLIAGTGGYPIDFGDGMVGTDPQVDTFLVRLSPQGVARWTRRSKISPSSEVFTAAAPDGSVWMAGDTNGTVDFGGGPRSSPTGHGIFSAHYSASGAYLDAFLTPSSNSVYVNEVAIDTTGQVILGGQAGGDIDFGLGPTTTASGLAYVLKHAASGPVRWAHRFGGNNFDDVSGVAVSPDNQIVAGGYLSKTAPLGMISVAPGAFVVSITP